MEAREERLERLLMLYKGGGRENATCTSIRAPTVNTNARNLLQPGHWHLHIDKGVKDMQQLTKHETCSSAVDVAIYGYLNPDTIILENVSLKTDIFPCCGCCRLWLFKSLHNHIGEC